MPGRGFAVVASRGAHLAQRSSQAAKDIKGLITSSNGQVQEGVKLVNQAGAALVEIVEFDQGGRRVVSEIASASIEQATEIEQVNKALNQMDEVTQQNSALVEENAATAKTLESQAEAMSERLSFFRVGDNNRHAAPSMRSAPAVKPKSPQGGRRPHRPSNRAREQIEGRRRSYADHPCYRHQGNTEWEGVLSITVAFLL